MWSVKKDQCSMARITGCMRAYGPWMNQAGAWAELEDVSKEREVLVMDEDFAVLIGRCLSINASPCLSQTFRSAPMNPSVCLQI